MSRLGDWIRRIQSWLAARRVRRHIAIRDTFPAVAHPPRAAWPCPCWCGCERTTWLPTVRCVGCCVADFR